MSGSCNLRIAGQHIFGSEQEAGVGALAAQRFERRQIIVWVVRVPAGQSLPRPRRRWPAHRHSCMPVLCLHPLSPSSASLSTRMSAAIHSLCLSHWGPRDVSLGTCRNLQFYFTHQHLKTRVCRTNSLGFPSSKMFFGKTESPSSFSAATLV